jgi:hypothetical protein
MWLIGFFNARLLESLFFLIFVKAHGRGKLLKLFSRHAVVLR